MTNPTTNNLTSYLLARLSERSTWRGLVALLTAAGLALSPDQTESIIVAGLGVIGLIGAFFSDRAES